MLALRLNRTGKNKRASFRLVVQEHTVAPGGKHVEVVGSYDPHTKKSVLKAERIQYWISKGAQVSDSAYNLLVREKVVDGKKREKKIKKAVAEAPAADASPEAPKTEEVKAEETKPAEDKKEDAPAEEVKSEAPVAEEKKAEEKKENIEEKK